MSFLKSLWLFLYWHFVIVSYITDVYVLCISVKMMPLWLACVTLVSLINGGILSEHISTMCPREFCVCSRYTVACRDHKRNLSYIPTMPEDTKTLEFNGNFLPSITKDTFSNISHVHLRELVLGGNHIANISQDAFSIFPKLNFLDLSGNQIPFNILKGSFEGLRHSRLTKLYLIEMGIGHLTEDFFHGLSRTPLEGLSLHNNNLTILNGEVFASLKYLRNLGLNHNNIQNISWKGLNKLKTLRLRSNKLNTVPSFCNENGSSEVPYLRVIDLGCNRISDIRPTHFRGTCLPSLLNLTLDENFISTIPNDTFSGLPKLKRLSIKYLRSNNVFFESRSLKSNSLRLLYVSNHMDMFDDTTQKREIDYKNIFRYCPYLEVLDMTKIRLTTFDGRKVYDLLRPLTKMQKLVLQSTSLLTLPENLFNQMPDLVSLNLKNCLLSKWNSSVFEGLHALKTLYLDHNAISLINETSFPKKLLEDIKLIDLGINPFLCSCDLVWFRNWMKTNQQKLKYYPYSYKCKSPPSWNGKFLRQYNPSYLDCNPINPNVIVAVWLSAAVVVIVIITSIIYKYRWDIKYYIYLMRARKGYQKIPGINDDYLYDAFVAYNSQDRVWVISKLIPKLEEEGKLRLCLHDRDFDVGKLILDNISDKINASRKIVLILSNNFARSQWCQFEMTMAQLRSVEEGNHTLVVVMLETIQTRNMSTSLNVLLKTTTFIQWTVDKKGEELFWKRLAAAVSTEDI